MTDVAGVPAPWPPATSSPGSGSSVVVTEPARDVPVVGSYDVVVCGGGPSGVVSATAAARKIKIAAKRPEAKQRVREEEKRLGGDNRPVKIRKASQQKTGTPYMQKCG